MPLTKGFCHEGTWVFDFNSLKSKQEISQLNRLSDFISEEPSPLFDALLKKKKGFPNQTAEGRLTPSAQRPFFYVPNTGEEEKEAGRGRDHSAVAVEIVKL